MPVYDPHLFYSMPEQVGPRRPFNSRQARDKAVRQKLLDPAWLIAGRRKNTGPRSVERGEAVIVGAALKAFSRRHRPDALRQ